MPKAKIRLFWNPSVSTDISKVEVIVTNGGVTVVSELPVELSEHFIEVQANSSYSYSVKVTDSDGLSALSVTYSGTVGDLVGPQPVTGLTAEIVETIPDPEPAE